MPANQPPLWLRLVLGIATRMGIVLVSLRDPDSEWHISLYKPKKESE